MSCCLGRDLGGKKRKLKKYIYLYFNFFSLRHTHTHKEKDREGRGLGGRVEGGGGVEIKFHYTESTQVERKFLDGFKLYILFLFPLKHLKLNSLLAVSCVLLTVMFVSFQYFCMCKVLHNCWER